MFFPLAVQKLTGLTTETERIKYVVQGLGVTKVDFCQFINKWHYICCETNIDIALQYIPK